LAISVFSDETNSVNTFAGMANPAGTVAPFFTRSATEAALLPTIAESRAAGVSSSTMKGACWDVGIAMDFTRASEHSVSKKWQKNRRSNGACEIRAQNRTVALFYLLAEADVCDCNADEDECQHYGESEEELLHAST
jgi:hypothetical protein